MQMWHLEILAQERIDNAIREAEHVRLARMVGGAKSPRTLRGLLDSVMANLRIGGLIAGWRPLQEPTP